MKPERFTAIFFLAVIMSLMSLVIYSRVQRTEYTREMSAVEFPVSVDWEKRYPFSDSSTHIVTPPPQELSTFDYIKQSLEEYTSKYLEDYYRIVEAERMYEELIGWNVAPIGGYNSIVRADDGSLIALVMSKDVSHDAGAMRDFKAFCRENGTELLYMNLPLNVCKSEDAGINGVFDYINPNADRFLAMLKDYGVKYYDFREILHEDGMNHHASFFRTDHHWKPETGLWAARRLLRIFRDDYGWNVDPEILDPENFNYTVYPEWFLGSRGKKVTLSRTTPDDITLIYPKFDNLIHWEVPAAGLDVSGDFSVIYEMRHIEPKDYYRQNPYAAYKYADQPLSRIHNLMNHGGKRVLFIHASLSNCVVPFVALGIEYTDEIDLRHFTGSVETFIRTERPDIVIVAYNSEVPGTDDRLYDFS
ncbi:MAG: hypothetical protein IJM68_12260 [Synergistaceae bacterium]|nr:hypothetical protein [Synergistaceae bacterium]MBQ6114617.1 hypothetical protein [Synergistaceae bacterium]MBQ6666347.1 hypothetical protein [Synergistaceae bacterium]